MYSHSYTKVKNVLGATLCIRYGPNIYSKVEEILFIMGSTIQNKFWVHNTIMVKMVEPGEVFGRKSMVYQDGKYISHKLKVINCEKSGEM